MVQESHTIFIVPQCSISPNMWPVSFPERFFHNIDYGPLDKSGQPPLRNEFHDRAARLIKNSRVLGVAIWLSFSPFRA